MVWWGEVGWGVIWCGVVCGEACGELWCVVCGVVWLSDVVCGVVW